MLVAKTGDLVRVSSHTTLYVVLHDGAHERNEYLDVLALDDGRPDDKPTILALANVKTVVPATSAQKSRAKEAFDRGGLQAAAAFALEHIVPGALAEALAAQVAKQK